MASKIPEIGKPNFRAIAAMPSGDVLKSREYYIVVLVLARRQKDSDTTEACIDWIVALTSEMRLRGGDGGVGREAEESKLQSNLITL